MLAWLRTTITSTSTQTRKRLIGLLLVVLFSFLVRGLTGQFIGERLNDAGWFQYGSYAIFDERAQNILDGKESFFWISDPTRTDLIQYPPAFPLFIAAIYKLSGERTSYAVHRVLWILDSLAVLLVVGLGVTAFGWRTGLVAGALAALSPLLAMYGVSPSSDAPTTWFVLASMWMLLLSARRKSWRWALGAGLMLGAGCWFRVNPLFLVVFWALALILTLRDGWRLRLRMSAALLGGTFLFVAPIATRNIVVFNEFVLTGLNVGSNLWEGLGETEFGRSLGAPYGDSVMVEQERINLALPPDYPITPVWPDGIRRDRERVQKSLKIIAAHPVWYVGVMAQRMWGMLKFVGEPSPYYGSPGFNCTSKKCLPLRWQGGVLAFLVNILGMIQSVFRYLALPLMALGIVLALRHDWKISSLLLATVIYYLGPGTFAHTEIRYVLPMQAVLLVFAGFAVCRLVEITRGVWKKRRAAKGIEEEMSEVNQERI
jgi:4-amino-4-deoxy-L-arabinose transferase-like glycosyltransferase